MAIVETKICSCGRNCRMAHVPIALCQVGPYGDKDWGNGFKTTMLPLCEARKAWAGDDPQDTKGLSDGFKQS